MASVIIDASVTLKWFYRDEENREKAILLLKKLYQGEIELLVPDLWLYEVANSFINSMNAKRLNKKDAKSYLNDLTDLNIALVSAFDLLSPAFEIADKYNLSVYDASYVALARLKQVPFYTADKKLINKLPSIFKNICDISTLDG